MIRECIRMAFGSLRANKMRSVLTMLGIIIGIAAVIAILTVGNSLTKSLQQSMQSMGSNDIYVAVVDKFEEEEDTSYDVDGINYPESIKLDKMRDEDYITSDMINEMCTRLKDKIYAVQISEIIGSGSAYNQNGKVDVRAIGASAGYFTTNQYRVVEGSLFSGNDFQDTKYVCLVDQTLVDKLFKGDPKKAIGKEIELRLDGVNPTYCTVVGVVERDSEMAGSEQMSALAGLMKGGEASVILPLKTGKALNHTTGKYEYFRLSANVGVDPEELAKEIRNAFEMYYAGNNKRTVTAVTFEGVLSVLTSIMDTVTLAISIIAGIALLVGGIGVMNIMLVSVTERTREIGTRKALGARNKDIRVQFLVEAVVICLIGGIIGLILGLVGGLVLSAIMGYAATPSIGGVIFAILFSTGIGVAFGYMPANKAAKMNPIDALRYE